MPKQPIIKLEWKDDRYGGGVSCYLLGNLIRAHVGKKVYARGMKDQPHPYVMYLGTKKLGVCASIEAGQKYIELKYYELILGEAKRMCMALNTLEEPCNEE